jgi:hypothetical protein
MSGMASDGCVPAAFFPAGAPSAADLGCEQEHVF